MSEIALTPDNQRKVVRSITNLERYQSFYKSHFYDFKTSLLIQALNADYGQKLDSDQIRKRFQVFGLVGMLGAQIGFGSMEGQIIRHNRRHWLRSPLSLVHQLSLAVYEASLNVQSYQVKKNFSERFSITDPRRIVAWGVNLPITNGQINVEPKTYFSIFEVEVDSTFESGKKIALPDTDLNQRLSVIEFSGDLADRISNNEFISEFLPQFAPILTDYLGESVEIDSYTTS